MKRAITLATALVAVLGVGSAALAAGEPWVLKNDMAYSIGGDGAPTITELKTIEQAHMAKAKAVPMNTVFFMKDGKMMMMTVDR